MACQVSLAATAVASISAGGSTTAPPGGGACVD
jgi:hypothetical protein